MANSDQQKAIKKLEDRVKENTDEIVAIRGLLKALLLQSKETDDQLRDFVRNEASNPVGRVEPEHAVSVANPLIEETASQREKNRKRIGVN